MEQSAASRRTDLAYDAVFVKARCFGFRPAIAAVSASAICSSLLLGACANQQSPPETNFATLRLANVGQGILAPNRIVVSSGGGLLYIATGDGEAYPEGYLHAVDATTLTEVRKPIEVGRNVSDMIALGDLLLVASRADGSLALVDPVRWEQLDRIQLGFSPIALAKVSSGEAAVVSLDSKELVVVGEHEGNLEILRRASAPAVANDVAATEDGRTIYVASPNVGIVSYDGATLRLQRTISLPNEDLGKGVIVWNGYVVTVSRDAYVYFINPASNAVTTIDVAADLGISRDRLPARGIDCNNIVDLGSGRLAVINNRQHSLVYKVDPSGPTAEVIGLMSQGTFGALVATQDRLLITLPLENAIESVALSATAAPSGRLQSERTVLGVGVAAVQMIGGANAAVAALDSRGAIHILGQSEVEDRILQPALGARWIGPFVAASDGTMGVMERATNKALQRLTMLDRDGHKLAQYDVALPNVFSFGYGNQEIALISRMYHQVQFIDRATGRSDTIVLTHDRPRTIVSVGRGDWLVFHDTNPAIGITRLHGHAEAEFSPFWDWFIGARTLDDNTVVAASFNGTMSIVSVNGSVVRSHRTMALHGLTDLEPGNGNDVWVTSSDLGAAYDVNTASLLVDAHYVRYGLIALEGL